MRPAPLLLLLLAVAPAASAAPTVAFSRAALRDRVYACFLGKNIGGTLGMPVEGAREPHDFTFYTPVPTEPAANDDLDLQLLWLKALEDRGPAITCRDLGDYWLRYVPVDWNEYGVGKQNQREGFAPPLSGQVRNARWRDSNGAWIRSEIWACVAPGCPALAARYAWEDACVDHGAAEGTWAEVFMAALQSAAFVERDPHRLIEIALSYLPADSAVATAVRAAVKARADGLQLPAAREAILQATAPTGWFMAPRNVAFVILGWLYGEGDFGRALCAAVNCGDDTDCTGATLGALLGILGGTAGIPERWRAPVGEGIRNVAIGGFRPPQTLRELTDRTVAMAPQVLAHAGYAVRLSATGPVEVRDLPLRDPATAATLAARSPYVVDYTFPACELALDYGREPVLGEGERLTLTLRVTETQAKARRLSVHWELPEGVLPASTPPGGTAGLPAVPSGRSDVTTAAAPSSGGTAGTPAVGRERFGETSLNLPARGTAGARLTLLAASLPQEVLHGRVRLTENGHELARVPFALIGKLAVRPDDLALASRGATATADSELERELGCAAEAIDGIIAGPEDFENRRWHSALTPHPHWLKIDLGKSCSVSRATIHFADPEGYPVDFDLEGSADGAAWQSLFTRRGYADPRRCDATFPPQMLRYVRLTIHKSANPRWPGAAQVSEIEVRP